MINRVLIRIKVVQMLYSYLLTQGNFTLQSAPTGTSRDKAYAYSLYVDLLMMMVRLSGQRFIGSGRAIAGIDDNRYLPANKAIRTLHSDDELGALARRHADAFADRYSDALLADLYNEITRSAIYRSYIRLKKRGIAEDVNLWTTLLSTVIMRNPEVIAVARRNPDYTAVGFEKGFEMAVETLNQLADVRQMYANARSSLTRSLDKAYDLYHALLLLPVELTHLEDQRLDAAKHKFLATPDDLNPNTRFVDNEMVKVLAANPELHDYLEAHPFSWNEDPQLIRSLLDAVTSSDIYAEYMSSPEPQTLKGDCDFWRAILTKVILPSDTLAEALESMSVYWNDDVDIISTFVTKTIKRIASGDYEGRLLLPQYKDDEDAAFGSELFVHTVEHFDEYRSMIDRFLDRKLWDTERLAFMDVVIMTTAISEMLAYPAIPIAVTMNEYIEIANSYSTPKSGQFINGILFSIINYLKEEGLLNK